MLRRLGAVLVSLTVAAVLTMFAVAQDDDAPKDKKKPAGKAKKANDFFDDDGDAEKPAKPKAKKPAGDDGDNKAADPKSKTKPAKDFFDDADSSDEKPKPNSKTKPKSTPGTKTKSKSKPKSAEPLDEEAKAALKERMKSVPKRGDAKPATAEPLKPKTPLLPASSPSNLDAMLGPPQSTEEFWLALERDMTLGLTDDAKRHLRGLIDRPDLKEKILDLREKYGSSLLLKLQASDELRDSAKALVDVANTESQNRARDGERIKHFIANLSKSAGQREYAITQLRRSGAMTVPYFFESLKGGAHNRVAVIEGLFSMTTDCWQPCAAALDSGDDPTIGLMIDLLRTYEQPKAAESLWYVAGNPRNPPKLREQAQTAIAQLTGIPIARLPSPIEMLSRIADSYYNHKIGAGDLKESMPIWRWEAGELKVSNVSLAEADIYYCRKYAGQVLDLDPTKEAVKVTLVSLGLEASYTRLGVDVTLPAGAKSVLETALASGPELMSKVLAKALEQRRTAVVLGAVQALGRTGNARLLVDDEGQPGLLTQALNYPNPRVQFAAAQATLNIHPRDRFDHAPRVVQTLVRALAPETTPMAMVLDGDSSRGNSTGLLLQQAGYESKTYASGRTGFAEAASSGAIDVVVIEPTILNWQVAETVANFRADARTTGTPILLISNETARDMLESLQRRYPRVLLVARPQTKEEMATALRFGMEDRLEKPLTTAEKAAYQRSALDWVLRLARGELPQFDVRPATEALASLMVTAELGPTAAEALGYLPSAQVQARLAAVALVETQPMPIRIAAANALARTVQRTGRGLDNSTSSKLIDMFEKTQDRQMRIALAEVVGGFPTNNVELAKRIKQYALPTEADAKPVEPGDTDTRPKKPDLEPPKKTKPDKAEKSDKPAKPGKSAKPAAKKDFFDDE